MSERKHEKAAKDALRAAVAQLQVPGFRLFLRPDGVINANWVDETGHRNIEIRFVVTTP